MFAAYSLAVLMFAIASVAAMGGHESTITNTSLSGDHVCTKRVVYQGTALETFLTRHRIRRRCLIGSFIDILKKKCKSRYYYVHITKIATRTVTRKMSKTVKYCCYGYKEVKGTCRRDIKVIVLVVVLPVLAIVVAVTLSCLCWCLGCKKRLRKKSSTDTQHKGTTTTSSWNSPDYKNMSNTEDKICNTKYVYKV